MAYFLGVFVFNSSVNLEKKCNFNTKKTVIWKMKIVPNIKYLLFSIYLDNSLQKFINRNPVEEKTAYPIRIHCNH